MECLKRRKAPKEGEKKNWQKLNKIKKKKNQAKG